VAALHCQVSTPNFARVNKFIFKKNVKHYFLQRFSNFNFRKKKEKKRDEKKRNKEGRAQFVINYCTSSHDTMTSTTTFK